MTPLTNGNSLQHHFIKEYTPICNAKQLLHPYEFTDSFKVCSTLFLISKISDAYIPYFCMNALYKSPLDLGIKDVPSLRTHQ